MLAWKDGNAMGGRPEALVAPRSPLVASTGITHLAGKVAEGGASRLDLALARQEMLAAAHATDPMARAIILRLAANIGGAKWGTKALAARLDLVVAERR